MITSLNYDVNHILAHIHNQDASKFNDMMYKLENLKHLDAEEYIKKVKEFYRKLQEEEMVYKKLI